ncbi:MAG TPA: Wzz/FepE/Etk N-terminal domain-containing protein, partial [Longimicrobiales bacterium]
MNGRPADKETARAMVQFVTRNRWLVLGVPLATLLLTALFVAWATPVYQGLATLRVDKERSNIAVLDALQELSNGASIYTEMAELHSRSVAEDVVDTLDLHLMVQAPRRVNRSAIFGALAVDRTAPAGKYTLRHKGPNQFELSDEKGRARAVRVGEPFVVPGATLTLAPQANQQSVIRWEIVPFQIAVRGLQQQLSVRRPDREAEIVEISYQSTDRELAQAVPNTAVRMFIDRRQSVKTQQARSTVAFLSDQLDTLGQQLRGYEAGLQRFREGQDVVSIEAQGEAQVSRLAQFQADRDVADAERSALSKLMAEIDRAPAVKPGQASPYRRLIGFPTILQNPAATEVMRSLNEMEN